MFMYEADPAVVDLTVAEMPAEVQPVIRDLGAAAYASYAKELYRTVAPPWVTGQLSAGGGEPLCPEVAPWGAPTALVEHPCRSRDLDGASMSFAGSGSGLSR
jgi:hypothetical protein